MAHLVRGYDLMMRTGARVALGLLLTLGTVMPAQAQQAPAPPAWSASVDPDQMGALTHLTISMSAPYCGGYKIGDGVYVQAEWPLVLTAPVPDGSALFANGGAVSDDVSGALRVAPAPDRLWSQVCIQGERPLSVELTPDAGFTLPDAPGTYSLDVWTGANPQPTIVTFDVPSN